MSGNSSNMDAQILAKFESLQAAVEKLTGAQTHPTAEEFG
jgi:hypothetical protein